MKNFLTNWKTTASGAATVVIGLASLFGVKITGIPALTPDAALTSIIVGLGLIFGKDGNVTGGNTPQ